MKKFNSTIIFVSLFSVVFLLCSCASESMSDKLAKEANILYSFKVKGTSGTVFNSSIGENDIVIKVSPYLDAKAELKDARATFYLSKGATVSPDPTKSQDFSQSEGVVYTVTSEDQSAKHQYKVTYGVSDKLPFGSGFSYAEVGAKKTFAELGYPGTVNDFGLPSIQYGDLQMYHAYCGNYIVLFSRAYQALGNTALATKVVKKDDLSDAGTLNLGPIALAELKMISSDYKGHCVGVVVNENSTTIYYWTTPSSAPVSVGTIGINMAPSSDLANNFQVAGDITNNAWISALAPRSANGDHYRVKVTGGVLASDYTTIQTGFRSSDCSGFQMISPLDDSDTPNYVVGDTEGTANAANSVHCYINNFSGATLSVMPPLWQNTLQQWWVGTGFSTARTGGRTPVVSALPINGKTYVIVTSGTSWWHAAAVLTNDLQTLSHENLNITASVNRSWSFGEWVDWYWDENESAAYLAVWFGRLGLYTYKLTCYE